jgi:hypothetical protein
MRFIAVALKYAFSSINYERINQINNINDETQIPRGLPWTGALLEQTFLEISAIVLNVSSWVELLSAPKLAAILKLASLLHA